MELFLLRFLLDRHFHNEAMQGFWQALLVVVGLLSGHVDGLQGSAAMK